MTESLNNTLKLHSTCCSLFPSIRVCSQCVSMFMILFDDCNCNYNNVVQSIYIYICMYYLFPLLHTVFMVEFMSMQWKIFAIKFCFMKAGGEVPRSTRTGHSIEWDRDEQTAILSLSLDSIKSSNVNPRTGWQWTLKCIKAKIKNEMRSM